MAKSPKLDPPELFIHLVGVPYMQEHYCSGNYRPFRDRSVFWAIFFCMFIFASEHMHMTARLPKVCFISGAMGCFEIEMRATQVDKQL